MTAHFHGGTSNRLRGPQPQLLAASPPLVLTLLQALPLRAPNGRLLQLPPATAKTAGCTTSMNALQRNGRRQWTRTLRADMRRRGGALETFADALPYAKALMELVRRAIRRHVKGCQFEGGARRLGRYGPLTWAPSVSATVMAANVASRGPQRPSAATEFEGEAFRLGASNEERGNSSWTACDPAAARGTRGGEPLRWRPLATRAQPLWPRLRRRAQTTRLQRCGPRETAHSRCLPPLLNSHATALHFCGG